MHNSNIRTKTESKFAKNYYPTNILTSVTEWSNWDNKTSNIKIETTVQKSNGDEQRLKTVQIFPRF